MGLLLMCCMIFERGGLSSGIELVLYIGMFKTGHIPSLSAHVLRQGTCY